MPWWNLPNYFANVSSLVSKVNINYIKNKCLSFFYLFRELEFREIEYKPEIKIERKKGGRMATSKKPKLSNALSKNNFYQFFLQIDEYIKLLNTNTLFVGLMMFVMNIASRFVTIKLSRSMEGYMKYSFSKDILVFAIAFIGTRDLYWALVITLVFIICMDYLFNEESPVCCLPESFTQKHIQLLESATMDSSGNNMGPGMGIGVSEKNSSIPGAPGIGYSVNNMQANPMENWGALTDTEKQKISEVLSDMRGSGSPNMFSSIDGNAPYVSYR